MKEFLGITYGALIVISYMVIGHLSENHFVFLFSAASLLLTIVTIPFLSLPIPRPISGVLIRAVMYSLGNYLVLASQSRGSTSSSLAAALLGSMSVSLFSLIKAPFYARKAIILVSLSLGVYLLIDQITISYLAFLSGFLQAATLRSASKVMRYDQVSIPWNLFIGFALTSIVGGIILMIFPSQLTTNVNLISVVEIATVTVCAQIAFFNLYRTFPVESAARYSLGRIPWAYAIEMTVTQKLLPWNIVTGAVAIAIAAFVQQDRRKIVKAELIPYEARRKEDPS